MDVDNQHGSGETDIKKPYKRIRKLISNISDEDEPVTLKAANTAKLDEQQPNNKQPASKKAKVIVESDDEEANASQEEEAKASGFVVEVLSAETDQEDSDKENPKKTNKKKAGQTPKNTTKTTKAKSASSTEKKKASPTIEERNKQLPDGFTATFTQRPDGRKDWSYIAPDGKKLRSIIEVNKYMHDLEMALIAKKGSAGAKTPSASDTTSKTNPSETSAKPTKADSSLSKTKSRDDDDEDDIPPTQSTSAKDRLKTPSIPSIVKACEVETTSLKAASSSTAKRGHESDMDVDDDDEKKGKGKASTSAKKSDTVKSGKKRNVEKTPANSNQASLMNFFVSKEGSGGVKAGVGVGSSKGVGKKAGKEVELDEMDVDEAEPGQGDDGNESAEEASSRRKGKATVRKNRVIESDSDFEEPEVTRKSDPTPGKKLKQQKLFGHVDDCDSDEEEDDAPKSRSKSAKATPARRKSLPKGKSTKKVSQKKGGDDDDDDDDEEVEEAELEPINKLPDMFRDLVQRIPELKDVARVLGGRKLRVATMCSGTESPLLALGLISNAIKEIYGETLAVEHVFSCEIEPFKQAYIERNFSPPILFRDVRELGGEYATTAYGANVKVPGNVDMLVAGTSCVDFSNLNNEKKELEGDGQSSRTFHGMLDWVSKHRPPLVILENVCGAPWPLMVKKFDKIKYDAEFVRADTKHYYIPHTRTRVYLVAVAREADVSEDFTKEWVDMVKGMRRMSSTPLEDYLIPTDDPRIHRARQQLAKTKDDAVVRGRTDWSRCESRHALARSVEELGTKRPLTYWTDGGMSNLPDYAWNDWGCAQTDRVLDLTDIMFLRLAKRGIDATFKTLVWNLSQNVDRNNHPAKPGICPCLTPSMIPFITNRGGPLVGLEALSLQGIPVDQLLLTRETEDQLADLAGNAMTSTVVGSCVVAALVLGVKAIVKKGDNADKVKLMSVEEEEAAKQKELQGRVVGEEWMVDGVIDLGIVAAGKVTVSEVLDMADKSARLCVCEGREGIAPRAAVTCRDCGHSSCLSCSGRPEHGYDIDRAVPSRERIMPKVFEKVIRGVLPVSLKLSGITVERLVALVNGMGGDGHEDREVLMEWAKIAGKVFEDGVEVRISSVRRGDIWRVNFEAAEALFVLKLDTQCTVWMVYARPPRGAKKQLRDILTRPVARMVVDLKNRESDAGQVLLNGKWSIFVPVKSTVDLSITGMGDLVECWQARVGLEGDFKDVKVWDRWRVSLPTNEAKMHSDLRSIAGVYKLFPKCGTAMESLHIKEEKPDFGDMYLFFDPMRCGAAEDDSFVFADNCGRLEFGDDRGAVAVLNPSWKPNSVQGVQKVSCSVYGDWVDASFMSILMTAPSAREHAVLKVISETMMEKVAANCSHACDSAMALVTVDVPVSRPDELWRSGRGWWQIDLLREGKAAFERLSWFLGRVDLPGWVNQWNLVETLPGHETEDTPCQVCAPAAPNLLWVATSNDGSKGSGKGKGKGNGGKVTLEAREDTAQAAVYEQALKNRPDPFICQLRHENGQGLFRIGVNVSSLMHRALARLGVSGDGNSNVKLSWRIVSESEDFGGVFTFPKLSLSSNRGDPESDNPPHFTKYPLRPEQRRSLTWMLRQEDDNAVPFVEEEISEASIESNGWRAEGRASREVDMRGGVLADQVEKLKAGDISGLKQKMKDQASKSKSEMMQHDDDEESGDEVKKGGAKKDDNSDPWGFNDSSVKKDWKKMKCPLFEMFHWNRVVVDEFTYLTDRVHAAILYVKASHRWVLSGTPPIKTFHDIKTMAILLGVNLGVDDEAEFNAQDAKRRRKEATQVELFHAFREIHSPAWHLRRHNLAQTFLDRFVRQNIAEIDEIKFEDAVVPVRLPPAERAIYLELEHHLQAMDMNSKKAVKSKRDGDSDREKRMIKALGSSNSAEEALMKRCSHFDLDKEDGRGKDSADKDNDNAGDDVEDEDAEDNDDDDSDDGRKSKKKNGTKQPKKKESLLPVTRGDQRRLTALETCDEIVEVRQRQMDDCCEDLWRHLCSTDKLRRDIQKRKEYKQFVKDERIRLKDESIDYLDKWLISLGTCASGIEDRETNAMVFDIVRDSKCQIPESVAEQFDEANDDGVKELGHRYGWPKRKVGMRAKELKVKDLIDADEVSSKPVADLMFDVRENSHIIRRLHKELAGRVRSLRFFEVVRNLLKEDKRKEIIRMAIKECPGGDDCPMKKKLLAASGSKEKEELLSLSNVAILSCCGHFGCSHCINLSASRQVCPEPGCGINVHDKAVVKASCLESGLDKDGTTDAGVSGEFGAKLTQLVDILRNKVGKDERALVFVQFPDLILKVAEALDAEGIRYLQIKGTATQKSKALQEFQTEGAKGKDVVRVLLLNVVDESAAGANLTVANHVIFLGPLLGTSHEWTMACETQAIGRAKRYGQRKTVMIWRLVADDTIDSELMERRRVYLEREAAAKMADGV
ncbi:hypothetical protein HDU76_014120 [Blyttiomyces sp. JEL0837]|nr:hypothetical protein HDU76_014120 [Blyttiomyces sp. JEL0837]